MLQGAEILTEQGCAGFAAAIGVAAFARAAGKTRTDSAVAAQQAAALTIVIVELVWNSYF